MAATGLSVQGGGVESNLVLQGRSLGAAELQQVGELVNGHPQWSRYRLSVELCRLWDWRAPNGQLKDMAARALLLKLEQRGHLRLPPKRQPSPNRMRHTQVRPGAACTARSRRPKSLVAPDGAWQGWWLPGCKQAVPDRTGVAPTSTFQGCTPYPLASVG
jgi:hypothetical protein